jgi:hypothetical protein
MRERMIEDMVGVMDGQFVNWINSAATYSWSIIDVIFFNQLINLLTNILFDDYPYSSSSSLIDWRPIFLLSIWWNELSLLFFFRHRQFTLCIVEANIEWEWIRYRWSPLIAIKLNVKSNDRRGDYKYWINSNLYSGYMVRWLYFPIGIIDITYHYFYYYGLLISLSLLLFHRVLIVDWTADVRENLLVKSG